MGDPFDNPSFASIDFGFDHVQGVDDFKSICLFVGDEGRVYREHLIMFPGINGSWSKALGTGPKFVTMELATYFAATSDQATFEQALSAKQGNNAYDLTYHGQSYSSAQLLDWIPREVLRSIEGWAYGMRYLLMLRVLNP